MALLLLLRCSGFTSNNVPSHQIDYLLNLTDHQDVPLCYTLMKEIWSLPAPVSTDKPSFISARNSLIMLGSLFHHLVLPYVQVTLLLHEQLTHLSSAAHLAAFLFICMQWSSKQGDAIIDF